MSIPDSVCESLRVNISRNPNDQAIEFRFFHAYLVKVDIGAFGCSAHRLSPSGSVAMLAGEPLLTCEGPSGWGRDAHLEFLQMKWDDGDFQPLRSASGTFCAAYFNPSTGTGHVIADRLGLRTLYYSTVGDFIYFASALRILEAIQDVPKKLDVLAMAEITGFSYPFGSGTPYAGIKMLLPCETLSIQGQELKSSLYFNWNAIAPVQATEEESLRETRRLFQGAVRRRLHGDRTTFAYLSGGLDSRCVVAALLEENARVYTFNFSPPNTQDQVLALQYAKQSGTIHHEIPAGANPNWSEIMANAWRDSPHRHERMPERPKVTWTGEGGSVGLGHVYLTPELVGQLRTGEVSGAIETFLCQQKKVLLTRILDSRLAERLKGHLQARLQSEIDDIRYPDPVRGLFIFLNLNGPRRHLVEHFETIDQHRLEYQVPFYDSELLEYLTSIAVEPCLYHRFYVKWLSLFDPAVREVPWQAYPGHVPSIVPVPDDLPDQWSGQASSGYQSASAHHEVIVRSTAMLADPAFPDVILRRNYLRLMLFATRYKFGNYEYALKAALEYYDYWKKTGGHCEMPSLVSVSMK